MSIEASVVVPTCRRPDLLERCLQALLAQNFDPRAYEIIVCDDGACRETRCLVERYATHICDAPAVHYLAVEGTHGPAAARNAGWQAASGAMIAFTDDDCIPDPSWLSNGVAALRNGAASAAGRVKVPLPPVPTDYERDAAGLEQGEFVTASCFCRRAALEAVGGFDERFTTAWREDSDLQFMFMERGDPIARVADAVVIHPVRPASWGISISQQRKSMFNALLYKKHPQLYRERIQAAPPWRYYLICASAAGALIACVLGRRRASLAGLALWAALVGRFCSQRLRHTARSPAHIAEMLVTSALLPPLAIFWRLRGALKYRIVFL